MSAGESIAIFARGTRAAFELHVGEMAQKQNAMSSPVVVSSSQRRRPCERCCLRQLLRTLDYFFCARAPRCEPVSQSRGEPIALRALSTCPYYVLVFRVRVRARVCVHCVRVCVLACVRGCWRVYCWRFYSLSPRRLFLGAQPKTLGWGPWKWGRKQVHFLDRAPGATTVVEPMSFPQLGPCSGPSLRTMSWLCLRSEIFRTQARVCCPTRR